MHVGGGTNPLPLSLVGVQTPKGYGFFLTNLPPRIGPRQVADLSRVRGEVELSIKLVKSVHRVNVLSGARLSRFYLPQMLQKNWGRIVFISSESGVSIPVEMVHYGVTKTAQIALARGLAEATAGTPMTVNSVLPGPTRSEGVERFVEDLAKGQGTDTARVEAEFFRTARPSSLLRRFATPEEVAAMVVYVCSPRASATNGAALRVDGGVVRSIV